MPHHAPHLAHGLDDEAVVARLCKVGVGLAPALRPPRTARHGRHERALTALLRACAETEKLVK